MKKRRCVVCGSSDGKRLRLFEEQGIKLRECNKCGVVFQEGVNEKKLKQWYGEDYEDFGEKKGLMGWSKKLVNWWRARRLVKLVPAKGKVLEVGCGRGDLLMELVKVGCQADGVEMSELASMVARKRGLKVRLGKFETVRLKKESYDLVVMQQVIEHFVDVNGAMKQLKRVLKPKGKVMIATPNVASNQRWWWGKYWYGWQMPFHIVLFGEKGLKQLLEQWDFKVMDIKYSWLPNDWAGSLMNYLQAKGGLKARWIKLWLLGLCLPLGIVDGWVSQSGRMVVIAERK